MFGLNGARFESLRVSKTTIVSEEGLRSIFETLGGPGVHRFHGISCLYTWRRFYQAFILTYPSMPSCQRKAYQKSIRKATNTCVYTSPSASVECKNMLCMYKLEIADMYTAVCLWLSSNRVSGRIAMR